jgi:hypothetical protein
MTTKRRNIHPYLSPDLYRRFKLYCTQNGVTETSVVEDALNQYLDEKNDVGSILKKLDRQVRSIAKLDNQVGILAEAFALYMQYWFAHTPEIDEDAKPLANMEAKRRYSAFVDFLAKRIGTGSRFTDEIVKDALGDIDELKMASRD